MLVPLALYLLLFQAHSHSAPKPPQTAEEAIAATFTCPDGTRDSGSGPIPGMTVRWCEIQKNGRPVYHGPVWRWYPNGQLDCKEYYLNGDAAGVWPSYYENGKPSSLGEFRNGSKTGTWKYWNESGYLATEVTYTEDGNQKIEYYPSGRRQAMGTFVSSGKIGSWTYWAEDGSEKAHCDFGKGVFTLQGDGCKLIADELDPKGFSHPVPEATQEPGGHISIRIEKQVYSFNTPAGWQSDVVAGKRDELPVVFYPKGKQWRNPGASIYIRICFKDGRSFSQMVADDKQGFQEGVADYHEISQLKGQLSSNRAYVQKSIRYHPLVETDSPFSIVASNVIHEQIAYVDNSEQVVLVIVLTSDTSTNLAESAPAFQEVLRSVR